MNYKLWNIHIVGDRSYSNVVMLPRAEGYFGMLRFEDADGKEHLVSIATEFHAVEVKRPEEK